VADDLGMQVPAREVLAHRVLAARAHQQQHALLRLGQHHFKRAEPGFAAGHASDVELNPEAATGGHLDGR